MFRLYVIKSLRQTTVLLASRLPYLLDKQLAHRTRLVAAPWPIHIIKHLELITTTIAKNTITYLVPIVFQVLLGRSIFLSFFIFQTDVRFIFLSTCCPTMRIKLGLEPLASPTELKPADLSVSFDAEGEFELLCLKGFFSLLETRNEKNELSS